MARLVNVVQRGLGGGALVETAGTFRVRTASLGPPSNVNATALSNSTLVQFVCTTSCVPCESNQDTSVSIC